MLYSPSMVLAKVAGIKTVTRRLVKNTMGVCDELKEIAPYLRVGYCEHNEEMGSRICPKWKPGDLIYGKEPFTISYSFTGKGWADVIGFYHADKSMFSASLSEHEADKFRKWKKNHFGKSSLFMFRSLARIWDEIVSVRVERLQDITEDDCLREGIGNAIGGCYFNYGGIRPMPTARESYRTLWDSLNAERAPWSSNPCVWRIETKPCNPECAS